MRRFLEKNYKIIVAFLLLFMLATSVFNAWRESAIFDETAHISASYSYVAFGDMRLNPEHPPLIKDLAGLPLLFLDINFDREKEFWTTDINGQWKAGNHILYEAGNNPDKIIFFSRLPIILLSIALGWFIFFWGKKLAGVSAGLLALSLYALSPNILGHSHFVTTDIGIAAFLTFSFYFFLKFIKEPSWKNVFWGGIFLGLLQLAKFSAVLAFPIFGLVIVIYPLLKVKRRKDIGTFSFKMKNLGNYLGKGIVAFAISLLLVWVVYALNTINMPEEKLAQTVEFYFPSSDTNIKNTLTNQTLTTLAFNPITKSLSEYFLGIAMVFKRVSGGNSAYYFGEVSSQAFASYFPVVYLMKTPFPTLILILSALIISTAKFFSFLRKVVKNKGKEFWERMFSYSRTHVTQISLFAFIILYSYLSITGNLNIGFRHLFPILPFAFILTGTIVCPFIRKINSKIIENSLRIITILLIVILFIEMIIFFPFYMSYFNQSAGGPFQGYRYVTDSNADWGQDLKRLKSFLEKNPQIDKIRVDYFGGGNPEFYLGEKYIPWWDSKRPVEKGWYAISVNFLQGSLHDKSKKDDENYSWLKDKKPVARVGTSIFIYYVE